MTIVEAMFAPAVIEPPPSVIPALAAITLRLSVNVVGD
jgi:hypothetical protein